MLSGNAKHTHKPANPALPRSFATLHRPLKAGNSNVRQNLLAVFEDRHLVLTTYFAVVASGTLLSRCPVPSGQMRNGRLVAGHRKTLFCKPRCCNRLVSSSCAYEQDGRRTLFMLLTYENGGLHLRKHILHILVIQ